MDPSLKIQHSTALTRDLSVTADEKNRQIRNTVDFKHSFFNSPSSEKRNARESGKTGLMCGVKRTSDVRDHNLRY